MKVRANAKINLTLDIVGKREDGYHLIDSVFQSVSLCDDIRVEKDSKITVCCTDGTISDKSNIAYKAAQIFFDYNKIDGGVKIDIEKHIPLASGMGGGSADAAAVILALDKIYKTNLSNEQLCNIALCVGADVPFCIMGGTARIEGIGEKITQLPNMPKCGILLIKQGVKHSTADMYKKIDSYPVLKQYTNNAVDGILHADIKKICNNVSNAFLQVCDNTDLINDIKTTAPLGCSLSGSGPTVFAIYNDITAANVAGQKLEVMGYNPIVTVPAQKGIVFE